MTKLSPCPLLNRFLQLLLQDLRGKESSATLYAEEIEVLEDLQVTAAAQLVDFRVQQQRAFYLVKTALQEVQKQLSFVETAQQSLLKPALERYLSSTERSVSTLTPLIDCFDEVMQEFIFVEAERLLGAQVVPHSYVGGVVRVVNIPTEEDDVTAGYGGTERLFKLVHSVLVLLRQSLSWRSDTERSLRPIATNSYQILRLLGVGPTARTTYARVLASPSKDPTLL